MANHKSAIKRNKQNLVKRERNKNVKSALKTAIKRVEAAVADNKSEEASQTLNSTVIALDIATSKGVIHKNMAARNKSRLTKKVNALSAAG